METVCGFSALVGGRTRIRRVNDNTLRVYVSTDLFELLDENHRERLAIGFCRELPDHLLIATAKDCRSRGHKIHRYRDIYVTFTTTYDPQMIGQLFPDAQNREFHPKNVGLHVKSTGQKAIAFEWPNCVEYLLAKGHKHMTTNYMLPGVQGSLPIIPEELEKEAEPSEQNQLGICVEPTQTELENQSPMNEPVGTIEANFVSSSDAGCVCLQDSEERIAVNDTFDAAGANLETSEEQAVQTRMDVVDEVEHVDGPILIAGVNQESPMEVVESL